MKHLTLFFLLLPLRLFAEEYTIQLPVPCYSDVKDVSKVIASYGEKAFFKALSSRLTEQEVIFTNEILMFVNPETRSWTLIEITKDRKFCVLAAGFKLEPAK